MLDHYGHQKWWPADSPFEVCIGAILTQNTAWSNVTKAIENLKRNNVLAPSKLYALDEDVLARLIRPSGYYNIKATRIRNFLKVLLIDYHGDLGAMLRGPTLQVRNRILAIKGVGKETADCILLYAGTQPSFVVDAYTLRIFSRHGWCEDSASYDTLQSICSAKLGHRDPEIRIDLWRDFHAQLVNVGKDFCRPRDPRCNNCPLRPLLPVACRRST